MSDRITEIAEATKIHKDVIFNAREVWANNPPMRRVLKAEFERVKEELRTKLETCRPDEVLGIQGQIKGLTQMHGIIEQQHN